MTIISRRIPIVACKSKVLFSSFLGWYVAVVLVLRELLDIIVIGSAVFIEGEVVVLFAPGIDSAFVDFDILSVTVTGLL